MGDLLGESFDPNRQTSFRGPPTRSLVENSIIIIRRADDPTFQGRKYYRDEKRQSQVEGVRYNVSLRFYLLWFVFVLFCSLLLSSVPFWLHGGRWSF